jgi:hypothetical protein
VSLAPGGEDGMNFRLERGSSEGKENSLTAGHSLANARRRGAADCVGGH